MKRVILPLVATMVMMSASAGVYAANQATAAATPTPIQSTTKTATPTQATTKTTTATNANVMIKLYAAPDTKSNVLASLDVSQQLIPIFQKDGWIKVGSPTDGAVGWINKQQYQTAVNSAWHQSVQTVYVQQVQQQGKAPELTVYQNGQKLTGDQAKAVVANMQKQQQQMQKSMVAFQQHMNAWMNQPLLTFPVMAMPQPVIIIENSGNNHPTANANTK